MTMRQLRNHAIALAALMLLAACTNDGSQAQPGPSPTEEESASSAAPETDYSIVGAAQLYGPGRWALPAYGDSDAPLAVLDVPDGFQGRESFVWTDQGHGKNHAFGQLAYWTATRVLEDPCNVDKPSRPLGRTIEDFAAALAAQQRTTTTEPVPVELDGHRGLYLELQSPTDVNYAACVPGRGMLLWEAGERGDGRGLEEPSTDRYWIMDVGGRRVIIAAMTPLGTDSRAGKA